jgi:C-terminal processing protease CtpA/Prc
MKTRDADLRFGQPAARQCRRSARRAYAGPLAILVDAMTGSASGVLCRRMQDQLGRARVFGQTSMGQALPAFSPSFPNGDVLIHATGIRHG